MNLKKLIIASSICVSCLSSQAFADPVEITVSSFPNFNQVAKEVIPEFEKSHPDIKVNLVTLAFGDHHNAMTTALATGANLPDVMSIEATYIGRFAQSGGLENLYAKPYDANQFIKELTPFTVAQATNANGNLSAIPADMGPGALFYRQDILDESGVTEADLTGSWESFIQAGIKVKEKTGNYLLASAGDIKDIYIRSDLKKGEGIYFDEDHNILVDSPRFKEAFKLAKEAREAGIDARVAPWSNEWTEGLRRGTIASQMMGAWLGGHLQDWIAPEANGVWRSAQLPNGSKSSWGGSFYAIPVKSDAAKKVAAWEFIKYMSTNKSAQLTGLKVANAFPVLIDAQNDPFFEEKIPYLGNQKARLEWSKTALSIPAVTKDKYDEAAKLIINNALEDVLENDADIDTVLVKAEKLIKRKVRRR